MYMYMYISVWSGSGARLSKAGLWVAFQKSSEFLEDSARVAFREGKRATEIWVQGGGASSRGRNIERSKTAWTRPVHVCARVPVVQLWVRTSTPCSPPATAAPLS